MKRKIIHFFVFALLFCLLANNSFATEYRRFGQDFRAMAMGNTGIASTNSSAALFYNPAAMANISNWWVDLPMLEISYSDDAKDLIDQARSGSFSLDTQQEQFDFMDSFVGKRPYVKFDLSTNLFINLTKKGMTFGYNYTYEAILDIEVRNPSLPEIHTFARLDNIRQAGLSVPIGLGKWVIGGTYKTVDRQEVDFIYGMSDALENKAFPTMDSAGGKGYGTGYDIGFLYRTPSEARIIIGGVWRKEILFDEVTKIPEESALGISMTHNFGLVRWLTAIDIRDLSIKAGSENEKSYNRRLHYGTEIGILPLSENSSWISIRGGYNQGYKSYGAEISLGHAMILGATKYSEETGEYAGQKPSSRTVLYFSLGF